MSDETTTPTTAKYPQCPCCLRGAPPDPWILLLKLTLPGQDTHAAVLLRRDAGWWSWRGEAPLGRGRTVQLIVVTTHLPWWHPGEYHWDVGVRILEHGRIVLAGREHAERPGRDDCESYSWATPVTVQLQTEGEGGTVGGGSVAGKARVVLQR